MEVAQDEVYECSAMTKTLGKFKLEIEVGSLTDWEIVVIVILGENGTGKTAFIRMATGLMKPDEPSVDIPELNVSYKGQTVVPGFSGSGRDLLLTRIRSAWTHPQLATDVRNQ